jgi:cytochrome P450
VQLTGRVALEDMEVAGATIAKGEFSMLLIGSANRDPDAFEAPETFDVTRSDNNHLGFGFGIHHCLGAPLARLEAMVAMAALLRRAPGLQRVTDELAYKENIVLRGLEALPVRLSA